MLLHVNYSHPVFSSLPGNHVLSPC